MLRQPQYSLLNILGLTIGLLSSLLILLYLFQEMSYDTQHQKADRIYRISSEATGPEDAYRWAITQPPLGQTVKEELAGVEQYVRLIRSPRVRLEQRAIHYYDERIYYVDSTMFEVFTFDFTMGDPQTALTAPNSIALSESLAQKIFKGENPMGKILKAEDSLNLKVTGIYKDMPSNSHFVANGLISVSTQPEFNQADWGSFWLYTYLLLEENADADQVEQKLAQINQKYVAPVFDEVGMKIAYELWPIRDIHLYSDFEGELEALGDIKYIYIFSAVGIFLLLIACINYMNLATARSANRAVEVGMRKVMGAKSNTLIGQFLVESILLTLIALVISLVLLVSILPKINQLLDLELQISHLLDLPVVLAILLIIFITGVLGGSYPAFYLSSFKPIRTLKGNLSRRGGNQRLRGVLVTTQFAISMFMLVGTLVIYQQMQYVQNTDLGFDREQVVRFRMSTEVQQAKWPVLRDQLLQYPSIEQVGTSSSTPGQGLSKSIMQVETETGNKDQRGIDFYQVDEDYFEVLDIPVIQGRNFSKQYPSDSSSAVVVNEALVRRMKWLEPIGKEIRLYAEADSVPSRKVIGVVKNFHQQSLYNPIEPLAFFLGENNRMAMIKITGKIEQSLAHIHETWSKVFPTIPLEYEFLDQVFMEQYQTDQLRGRLFLGFSLMTVLIACLGLLGLASYTAEQRSKEISIRKILGADTFGLIRLLVQDFIWLVLIAALPAFLLSWYFMEEWLQGFEYHIEIGATVFMSVLIFTLVVTILMTSYHAWRAASSNPADNLKYE